MAWIVVVPPSPRHPHERYQVCYQQGKRHRSAGIFLTRRRALAEKRAIDRGRDELVEAHEVDLERTRTLFGEYVAANWWPAWKDQHPTSEYGTPLNSRGIAVAAGGGRLAAVLEPPPRRRSRRRRRSDRRGGRVALPSRAAPTRRAAAVRPSHPPPRPTAWRARLLIRSHRRTGQHGFELVALHRRGEVWALRLARLSDLAVTLLASGLHTQIYEAGAELLF